MQFPVAGKPKDMHDKTTVQLLRKRWYLCEADQPTFDAFLRRGRCFFVGYNLAVVSARVNGLMCAAQRQLNLPGVIPVMLLALTGKWLNTSLAGGSRSGARSSISLRLG